LVQQEHATMAKNFTVRLPDDEATNVDVGAVLDEVRYRRSLQ
jgi:hypothetical protein